MFRVLTCLTTEHDWRLVVVAGVVCFLASLTAVSLFHRARASAGRPRAIWIAAAGAATGCGIWATHFIAMLAYDPGVSIAYNIGLTALSLMAAATITAVGLAVAVYNPERWAAPAGGAIVAHHFTAMGAVEIVPDPTRIMSAFSLSPGALAMAVANAALAVLGMSLISAFADSRLDTKSRLLAATLDSMTQGVV